MIRIGRSFGGPKQRQMFLQTVANLRLIYRSGKILVREKGIFHGLRNMYKRYQKVQQSQLFLQMSELFASYLLCIWAVFLTTLHSAGKFSCHCRWEHTSCYKRRTRSCQFLHSAHWWAQGLPLSSYTHWLGPQGPSSFFLQQLKERIKEELLNVWSIPFRNRIFTCVIELKNAVIRSLLIMALNKITKRKLVIEHACIRHIFPLL